MCIRDSLMIEAIKQRDFPIVQGSVLFVAACFSLVNLAVDLLYACLLYTSRCV